MSTINNSILQWITYDDNIKKNNNNIKVLRDKKNQIENDIINYLITNKMENNTFKITDIEDSIEYTTIKTYENINYKYLSKCFFDFFNKYSTENKSTEELSNELLNYIKNNRSINNKEILKRTINN